VSENHQQFEIPPGCPDIVSLGIQLWGEPTKKGTDEVKFGKHESKTVRPAPVNTWYDHEAKDGGGYTKLYKLKFGKLPDLPGFPIPPGMAKELGNPVSWWDYHDASGNTVARVVRFHPPGAQDKTYRQCRPDGDKWRWKMAGQQIPLYRLPSLLAASPGDTVYITEGEKHADLLRDWGLLATTNAGGAKKFRSDHAATLARFNCVVLPDNDQAGREHRDVVVKELRRAGCQNIRVIDLSNLPQKGDVIDWAAAGGTRDALDAMVAVAPIYGSAEDIAALIARVQAPLQRPPASTGPGSPDDLQPADDRGPAGNWTNADEPPPEIDDAGYIEAVDADSTSGTSKRRRVRGEVDDSTPEIDGPVIRVVAGRLHITTTEAESALIASGLPIYQRGDGLVQPIIREVAASHGRMTLAAGLGEMNVYSMVDVMCATAEYERYDARSKDWIRINPPAQIAQTLLSRQGKWHFPVIAGIVTTPTLRPDGTVLVAAGYDPATRLYHVKDDTLDLSTLPAKPTRADAERALRLLKGLLTEFPFVGDVDRSVALSGIITPVIRGAISVAPLHVAKATTAGTGKSFLVDIISAIATGRICPVASAGEDPAETEKRLVGLLLAGYPVVSIDNCNGELGGDLLCQAIERPLVRVRALGRSDIFEIESRATIYATGNALRVSGDMVRRTIVATLDAQMERPELREFTGNPVGEILADRGWYVAACLTIAMAYQAAGYPDTLPPLASFEDWSTLVRSALAWLGETDPCKSMETAREDDPELNTLREVLGLWQSDIGIGLDNARTMRHVAERASTKAQTIIGEPTDFLCPDLRDVLLRIAGVGGTINTRKLGNWLADHEGRIVGGVKFKRHPTPDRTGVVRWAVVGG
jgi:hypothetical protein